jgi:cobalt-zinc-cadmium resistance protein CzcA
MEVVTRVREIARMNTDGTLPPGVKIEAFYDRGDLVAVTVSTVLHNMFFGIALIFLIQWAFSAACARAHRGGNHSSGALARGR